MIYYGASGWTRLGVGTAGNLLQTNGSGADPSWASPPAGSGFTTLISGNSGTANASAAPQQTWQVLTANAAANSTTTIATVMTTSTLPAGTYRYRYEIITQSGATTTAQKFSVNATGTVTRHVYNLFFPSAGVTASTGVVDQDINVTTGAVWAHLSTRTNNTTLGPATDHDATGDVLYVIEGVLITTTSGNLLLGHASEVAAASTVQAGTMLKLERLA